MEDRYEIRGKIGQGGLGAVYRGYDTRMKREVAIKRISVANGEGDMEEESTRQLIKEAGALASLQHPHIVTVYDVGTDEDGPYVVMELISGKTLDELIDNAPLTWTDFRELAMQTQEALIAAQELDMIHSDLKPSNLMLTWLPSGRFQVKIVDFGLATLTQSQSKEDFAVLKTVFGSILFMAPEQFERKPLDARSDLYSIGCVYYQALAGVYPFDGKTGNEVMESHLLHKVTPLQEIRSDIPVWACDWVMWLINRMPEDRPESARESLAVFLQNDKRPDPTMSLGPAQPDASKRPRLIIPGSAPAPLAAPPPAEAIPVAIPVAAPAPPPAPVAKVQAAIPVAQLAPARPVGPPPPPPPASVAPPEPAAIPKATPSKTAPQPLAPPKGSKPSVHSASQSLPEPMPQLVAAPTGGTAAVTMQPQPAPKRKVSNAAKTTIAAILGLLVVLFGWMILDRSGKNKITQLYNQMITEAAKGDATEVSVTAHKLQILLDAAANTGANEQRQTIYKALFLAKAIDGTDVDGKIAEFATGREMLPDVREVLIRDVLRMRKNPSVVPTLMNYARSTSDVRSAVSAIQAVRFMAGEEQFEPFLDVLQTTTQEEVRKATEDTMAEIIKKSAAKDRLAAKIAPAYDASINENVRHSILRLLGRCGGDKPLEIIKKALASDDLNLKFAALTSLGAWGDDGGFATLTGFLTSSQDEKLRGKAFEAALKFVSDPTRTHTPAGDQQQWTELNQLARTRAEQESVIRGLYNFDEDWSLKLLTNYSKSDDDRIVDLSQKAIEQVTERIRVKKNQK
jgi:serine/threonine protein kinase